MEEAAPAGTNKVYYDGCPGCAMDRRKESRAGVPYKELLFVAAATFASGTYVRPRTTLRLSPPTPPDDADGVVVLLLPALICSAPSICLLSMNGFHPNPDSDSCLASMWLVLFYCYYCLVPFGLFPYLSLLLFCLFVLSSDDSSETFVLTCCSTTHPLLLLLLLSLFCSSANHVPVPLPLLHGKPACLPAILSLALKSSVHFLSFYLARDFPSLFFLLIYSGDQTDKGPARR